MKDWVALQRLKNRNVFNEITLSREIKLKKRRKFVWGLKKKIVFL